MIQVSWGMIFFIAAVGTVLAIVVPFVIGLVVRRELRAYLPQVDALSGAMNEQYRALKLKVEVAEVRTAAVDAKVEGVIADMKLVKHRVGLIGPPREVTE